MLLDREYPFWKPNDLQPCHLSLGPTPNKLALAQRCIIHYIVLSLQRYSTNAPQLVLSSQRRQQVVHLEYTGWPAQSSL